nr:vacuolar protein sorting-associated protein atg6 [Quercus suber]
MQCQKCRTLLKLDGSLESLNPASFQILVDAAPVLAATPPDAPRSAAARERKQQYDEVSKHAGSPIHKRLSPGSQRSGNSVNPDMSYIMLTESQIAPEASDDVVSTPSKRKDVPRQLKTDARNDAAGSELLSQQLDTTLRLFEILSSRSDIDHPICTECTELLLDGLQKRQASVIRERDAYVGFLKQAQEDVPTAEEKAATKRKLENARLREEKALSELEALEAEKSRMEAEIAALDAEAEQLDEEEERFWRERNAFTSELAAFQEERDSLKNQLVHDTRLLESLQRTNVYNDAFSIGHDGLFGTINGLRLGRLPDHPVEWAEINAALGQTVLLLAVVVEKLGVQLRGYRLITAGSTSKLVKEEAQPGGGEPKQKVYELYSSGDLPLGLGGLFQGKFDAALVEFLQCIRQLGDFIESKQPQESVSSRAKLPYKIAKDRIGEVSIKLSYGHDDQWTKACKCMLTCCKFLLAYASHENDSRNG